MIMLTHSFKYVQTKQLFYNSSCKHVYNSVSSGIQCTSLDDIHYFNFKPLNIDSLLNQIRERKKEGKCNLYLHVSLKRASNTGEV